MLHRLDAHEVTQAQIERDHVFIDSALGACGISGELKLMKRVIELRKPPSRLIRLDDFDELDGLVDENATKIN